MFVAHVTFAHRFIQQMLCLAGATFIELAKISTIAVPARTRRASYTGTWPQARSALVDYKAIGFTEHSSKLLHAEGQERQKQEASEYLRPKKPRYLTMKC